MQYIRKFNQYTTVQMPTVVQKRLIEESRMPTSERPTVKIQAVVVSK